MESAMVDLALVSGMVGTLKTAFDIGKTVKEINDISQVRDKVIEMQDFILSAQSSAMTAQTQLYELLQENAELKQKASAVDEWNKQAARYQLKDYGGGTFAYELTPEHAQGEPLHRLCTVCFQNKRKSILHFSHVTALKQDLYKCMPCNTEQVFGVSHPVRIERRGGSEWMA